MEEGAHVEHTGLERKRMCVALCSQQVAVPRSTEAQRREHRHRLLVPRIGSSLPVQVCLEPLFQEDAPKFAEEIYPLPRPFRRLTFASLSWVRKAVVLFCRGSVFPHL